MTTAALRTLPFIRNAVFLILAVLTLATGTARAECVDECYAKNNCDIRESRGESVTVCYDELNQCLAKCTGQTSIAPHRIPGAYGALAFDLTTGTWALSDPMNNTADAEKVALKYCYQHGYDCKIVDQFSNSCIVVAKSVDGKVTWSHDKNVKIASQRAIEDCSMKAFGQECIVQGWQCFFP